MPALDGRIAGLSDGSTLAIVLLVAMVLGLRHASDPDHLAAVTTLMAAKGERRTRCAAVLGLGWGAGHGTSLFAFGLPVVLYRAFLPEVVQTGAETAVGMLIAGLAAWLLVRWRRGAFSLDAGVAAGSAHAHPGTGRTPLQAYGIGLVHGAAGSAGVSVLLVASIQDHVVAIAALAVFACFTAVSMTLMSTAMGMAFGRAAARRWFGVTAPALGVLSLAFGVWYVLGALSIAPYGL